MRKVFWWTESKMLYALDLDDPYSRAPTHEPHDRIKALLDLGFAEISHYTARQLGLPS